MEAELNKIEVREENLRAVLSIVLSLLTEQQLTELKIKLEEMRV